MKLKDILLLRVYPHRVVNGFAEAEIRTLAKTTGFSVLGIDRLISRRKLEGWSDDDIIEWLREWIARASSLPGI